MSPQKTSEPREFSNSPAVRLLIIRFSSFGDIVQACPVPAAFLNKYPDAQIDWLTREDFASLLAAHPHLNRTYSFHRKNGLKGLIQMAWELGGAGYTHLYDAHCNLRSRVFSFVFRLRSSSTKFLRRPKERWKRWLFFKLKIRSSLPQPYRGSDSFLWPLKAWGVETTQPPGPQFWSKKALPPAIQSELDGLPKPWVIAAPSAAWEMKRWPRNHWKKLIQELKTTVILLGGPDDHFVQEIADAAPERSLNLAGRLKLEESTTLIQFADLVISGDTGLLHVADLMERPTIALIGPTAFGYPSRENSRVLEVPNSSLPCKPCSKDGRGKCRADIYKKCLVMISPETVARKAHEILGPSAAKGLPAE